MINENYIVSVPYRGYSFFNHFTLRIFGTCLFNIVSVPYRGYSFFNEQLCQAFREWLKTPFPSLTGVIRFLITEFIHVATAQDNVSVPYRGYSFFNCRRCAYISVVWFVSVPYRGYSFFNKHRQKHRQKHQKRFPSLTGVIRFLIEKEKIILNGLGGLSFRPLQGLFVF